MLSLRGGVNVKVGAYLKNAQDKLSHLELGIALVSGGSLFNMVLDAPNTFDILLTRLLQVNHISHFRLIQGHKHVIYWVQQIL